VRGLRKLNTVYDGTYVYVLYVSYSVYKASVKRRLCKSRLFNSLKPNGHFEFGVRMLNGFAGSRTEAVVGCSKRGCKLRLWFSGLKILIQQCARCVCVRCGTNSDSCCCPLLVQDLKMSPQTESLADGYHAVRHLLDTHLTIREPG
jgi:hypothetical protein